MSEKKIDLDEAEKEVELVSKRLALLHLSYAKTLIDEFGKEKGEKLVLKAIKKYGKQIGKERRKEIKEKGLETDPENFSKGDALRTPRFGMHSRIEKEKDKLKAYGCVLGDFWKDEGESDIGRLYCYVDAAKYMGFNEDFVQIHSKAITMNDPHCKFLIKSASKEQKELFESEDADFSPVDNYLED